MLWEREREGGGPWGRELVEREREDFARYDVRVPESCQEKMGSQV